MSPLAVQPADSERQATLAVDTILGQFLRTFGGASGMASTAWPANNQGFVVPFQVATPVTILELAFMAGTTPGTTNYDLGVYSDQFTRLASLGSTASVNTSTSIQPAGGGALATPLTLNRGRYFLAMSAASTTLTCFANAPTNQASRALGVFQMASAFPLPTTFVPASMGTTAFVPQIIASTVPNLL